MDPLGKCWGTLNRLIRKLTKFRKTTVKNRARIARLRGSTWRCQVIWVIFFNPKSQHNIFARYQMVRSRKHGRWLRGSGQARGGGQVLPWSRSLWQYPGWRDEVRPDERRLFHAAALQVWSRLSAVPEEDKHYAVEQAGQFLLCCEGQVLQEAVSDCGLWREEEYVSDFF